VQKKNDVTWGANIVGIPNNIVML